MPQPPLVIDPLSPQLVPPGLFDVATGPLALPEHAQSAGAVWVPDTCGPGEKYAAACLTPPYPGFVLDLLDPLAQAWPFINYATVDVGAAGWTQEEIRRRVELRLRLQEQYVAEFVLSGKAALTIFSGANNVPIYMGTTPGGTAPTNGVAGGIFQQMAAGKAAGQATGFVDLTGSPAATVADAVSQLEQAAADNYYGQAIIHARPAIAAYAGKSGQFRVIGLPEESNSTQQYTQNWNAWLFGNGYTGTGPTNQAPDATSEYVWATGRIAVWRGDVIHVPMEQVFDRQLNQRLAFCFRPYMIGVECFSACAKVTRA